MSSIGDVNFLDEDEINNADVWRKNTADLTKMSL